MRYVFAYAVILEGAAPETEEERGEKDSVRGDWTPARCYFLKSLEASTEAGLYFAN